MKHFVHLRDFGDSENDKNKIPIQVGNARKCSDHADDD